MKGLKTVVTALVLRRINATARAPQKEVAGIIVEIDGTMTRVMMPTFSVSSKPVENPATARFYYGEMC